MRPTALLLSLLLLFLLLPLPVHAEDAPAKLLIEANTGCILSESDADRIYQPGSLAKLMTAYLTAQAVESGRFTEETVLTAGESVREVTGAVIWLEPGDSLSVSELLTALLAGNANDAAAVLADSISGTAERFVMDMNAAAFDLGMRSTCFTTPQGYADPQSRTTAADMGLLACAVLRCEMLVPHMDIWRTFVKNDTVEIVNENTLTRTYDGCQGMKAAREAGYHLIAAAERDGLLCAAVVLGCDTEDERFPAAKQLLEKGFSGYRLTSPGFAEEFLRPLTVQGGTESAVLLTLSQIPLLAVPRNEELTSVMVLPEYVQAPVQAGQQVGTVYFYHEDTLLCETALLSAQTVPALDLRYALRKMLHFLFS